ncbi:MAG: hypothetical protein GY829_12400, partial [Gammaproteobacteria bacterium]|nr:hypothetical protein [Gammaproteobacteria bacterium]
EENKDNLFEIDVFYSIDNPSVDSLKDVFASWEETLGSKSLPIGSDGGGNQIYLKFESEEHSVWLYLHDENGVRLKLANGFTDFLDSLISNPDFI